MSVIRRRVYESDRRLRRGAAHATRTTTSGCARRSPASGSCATTRPLGHYRRRDDSVSASDVRMMRGILRGLQKIRPLLLGPRRRSCAILDAAGRAVRARAARRRRRAIAMSAGEQRGGRRPPVGAVRAAAAGRSSASRASWRAGRRGCCRAPTRCAAPAGGDVVTARRCPDVARAPDRAGALAPARSSAVGRLGGRPVDPDRGADADEPRRAAAGLRAAADGPAPPAAVHRPRSRRPAARVRGDRRRPAASSAATERAWRRFDLYINADPWEAVALRRVDRQLNFFHGVAGKYDLDCPAGSAARVRPLRSRGLSERGPPRRVRRRRASSRRTGPCWSAIRRRTCSLTGRARPATLRGALGLDAARPTVDLRADVLPRIRAATSPARRSSRRCSTSGCNVIAKLHDRSLDPDPRYTGGINWRERLGDSAGPHFLLAASGDSTPYVLASDVMVTDHSSIGFEFCVARSSADRLRCARPDRSRANQPGEGRAAPLRRHRRQRRGDSSPTRCREALASPRARSRNAARAANEVFYRPGTRDRPGAAPGLRAARAAVRRRPSRDGPPALRRRASHHDRDAGATLKYSIVIATYNRAADLRETLKSLAGLQPDGPWEVIVVDNNSPDDTRAVV